MPPSRITVEDTPNPQARKFIADRVINPGPTRSHLVPPGPGGDGSGHAEGDAQIDSLVAALFAAGPITSVMLIRDFVTVNKKPSARWARLEPKVIAVLEAHLAHHEAARRR